MSHFGFPAHLSHWMLDFSLAPMISTCLNARKIHESFFAAFSQLASDWLFGCTIYSDDARKKDRFDDGSGLKFQIAWYVC